MIFLVSLITAAYVGLGVRLVDIQVFQHEKHAAHAEDLVKKKEQSIPHVDRLRQHAVNVASTEKNQKLVKGDKQ